MTILIAYGTVEGQTGKIAKFIDKEARALGLSTRLFDTGDRTGDLSFEGIDRVILAASVHERRHPSAFEVFVASNREALEAKPTLFLSVSLKAAFEDGQEEAQDFADEMKMRTKLAPDEEMLVAGAIRTASYDHYAAQVMRHVVLRGQPFDPTVRDHEFTDWEALKAKVAEFLSETAPA